MNQVNEAYIAFWVAVAGGGFVLSIQHFGYWFL